jgi:hypothetical protein
VVGGVVEAQPGLPDCSSCSKRKQEKIPNGPKMYQMVMEIPNDYEI